MYLSKVAISCVISLAFAGTVSAQTIQINRENKTIAISTSDEATAIADIAAISVGFDLYEPDAPTAYSDASRLSHNIMDALHKAGIDDKSIESKDQSLSRNTNLMKKTLPSSAPTSNFISNNRGKYRPHPKMPRQ